MVELPCWPPIMRADTAAAYLNAKSVGAFRRRVGKVYPHPRNVRGRGKVWLKTEIDQAIAALAGTKKIVVDAAAQRPKHVQVRHPKTGAVVWLPLEDGQGRLYPEIEAYLADLPQPVVLTTGTRGPVRPYCMVYAQRLVRAAREKANLPVHVTLDACRHGGMTELGDSGVSEQGGMSLTGRSTPQALRLYVKRTEAQRMIAARQRRAWVEANETGSEVRIGCQTKSQNER